LKLGLTPRLDPEVARLDHPEVGTPRLDPEVGPRGCAPCVCHREIGNAAKPPANPAAEGTRDITDIDAKGTIGGST